MAFSFETRAQLALAIEIIQLGKHRSVIADASAVEFAPIDCRAHGAVRLVFVRTVRETTPRAECLDIGEGQCDAVVTLPHADTAQTGRVDQHSPAGQHEQLTVRCRMTASTIGVADRADRLRVFAEQRIHQTRLADARLPDERDR